LNASCDHVELKQIFNPFPLTTPVELLLFHPNTNLLDVIPIAPLQHVHTVFRQASPTSGIKWLLDSKLGFKPNPR
jgi:hypothetical protein